MTVLAAITTAWLAWIIVLVVSSALDGMYSGMESGIYVINKIRLDLHASEGSKPAKLLQKLLRRPDNLLAVLLIGTNITRYLATFSISAMFVMAGYSDGVEWYTLAVATPILFVINDAVPKGVYQRLRERIVYRLAWFLRVSDIVFRWTGISPLVCGISAAMTRLLNPSGGRKTYHRQGISAVLAEGQASGALTHFQSVMADRVINIRDVKLANVMIPMASVVSAPLGAGREEILAVIRSHNYSRLPLLDDSRRVAGVLNVYDVLADRNLTSPAEVADEPMVLPASANITDALYRMRRRHKALAVVEDEGGTHVGIVTIKDLVEEIVGDLAEW